MRRGRGTLIRLGTTPILPEEEARNRHRSGEFEANEELDVSESGEAIGTAASEGSKKHSVCNLLTQGKQRRGGYFKWASLPQGRRWIAIHLSSPNCHGK